MHQHFGQYLTVLHARVFKAPPPYSAIASHFVMKSPPVKFCGHVDLQVAPSHVCAKSVISKLHGGAWGVQMGVHIPRVPRPRRLRPCVFAIMEDFMLGVRVQQHIGKLESIKIPRRQQYMLINVYTPFVAQRNVFSPHHNGDCTIYASLCDGQVHKNSVYPAGKILITTRRKCSTTL
jgi:hypothetical protein